MANLKLQTQNSKDESFVDNVMKWFSKLMNKFTKGKYETKEEKEFFSDEKNLYNEEGDLTPEYKSKIKEFEDYIKKNDVNEFLKQVHSESSEEFGEAYSSQEQAMLESACQFIDDQEAIVKALNYEMRKAMMDGQPFDFDDWFAKYCEANGIFEEHISEAKNHFVETLDDVLKGDPELGEFLKKCINQVNNEN